MSENEIQISENYKSPSNNPNLMEKIGKYSIALLNIFEKNEKNKNPEKIVNMLREKRSELLKNIPANNVNYKPKEDKKVA